MPKIENWSMTFHQNSTEVGIGGDVRKWENDETGNTVTIWVDHEDDFYGVRYDGEPVTGYETLTEARDNVVEMLRDCPGGWE